jgi:hydroxymethylglutaryl-CoA lyase
MPFERALQQVKEMIQLSRTFGMHIRASIQCAFGCAYEGRIPPQRVLEMAGNFKAMKVDMLSLADTTGMADPVSLQTQLKDVQKLIGNTPLGLHLHDTRGLGLVNVVAALECGITFFDTALGGMGGCPFVPGAAGNIATEDTAYLLKSLQIDTGIDIVKVAKCSRRLAEFLNKSFAGKMYRILTDTDNRLQTLQSRRG